MPQGGRGTCQPGARTVLCRSGTRLDWSNSTGLMKMPCPCPRETSSSMKLDEAPRVFGLWSGLGCCLRFAFRKSLWGPSIFSLVSSFSTLGNLPWDSPHHATSSPFPQIVPMLYLWPGLALTPLSNYPSPALQHRGQGSQP